MFIYPFVCVSVRMEQILSHWIDLHKIWCMGTFRTSVEGVQVSLKSDKINWYVTWRELLYMKTVALHEESYFTWRQLFYMKTVTLHEDSCFTCRQLLYVKTFALMKTVALHEDGCFTWRELLYMKTVVLHEDSYFTWRQLLYVKTLVHLLQYLSELLSDWEISQTQFAEQKTTQSCSIIFFRKSCHLWDNVGLSVGARQTTDDNTIHPREDAIFMSGKEDKENTYTQNMHV